MFLLTFNPVLDLVAPMPWLVNSTFVNAFLLIGVFPFSRSVHILVVPNPYLWRRPQVVRCTGAHRDSWSGSLPSCWYAMSRRGRALTVLAVNTTAFTVCFAAWTLNGVLVTYLVDNGVFEWTESQMGWLIGLPVLTGSLARLPLGILTDQLRRATGLRPAPAPGRGRPCTY